MDSTETAAGLPADERAPNGGEAAVKPETSVGLGDAGTPAGRAGGPAEAGAESEASDERGPGFPRARRRRRRRRHPAQMTVAAAGAPGETVLGETVFGEAAAGGTDLAARPGEASAGAAVAASDLVDDGGGAAPRGAGDGETAEGAASPERPLLRLRNRNRRRRRRPPVLGLTPGHDDTSGDAVPPAIAAIRAALAPGQRSFSVPRRQRRHAPLSAGAAGAAAGTAPPRSRRRRRRPGDGAASGTAPVRTADAGAAAAAERDTPGRRERRAEARGGPRDRDRGERRGSGGERARDRARDRDRGGRGAPPKRAEQKLYSVDSVVDRGFEDIEEDGGETRRVHWTIVKRTTADQISRKPVSTVYVLQREGADTEFPTLGTARSAVNKTIVHPEKLTPSKAERAIAKK